MPGDRLHRPDDREPVAPAERPDATAGRLADDQVQPTIDDRVRPGNMSSADERHREALDELPAGHPSSPYEMSGRRRDDQPDLRDLELPLPDELDEGDAWGGTEGVSGAGPDQPSEAAVGRGETPADGRPDDTGAQSPDEPPSDEPRPGEPPSDRRSPEEPDETPNVTTDESAADAPRDPEAQHHDYWTEIPRFRRMWSDHEHEWPEETQPAASVDRSRDPDGSWRSDSNLFLAPDTHARTKEAIGKVHEAETRVTTGLDQAVKDSPFGGELVGLDYRRKGEDRLKEKVAEKLKVELDRTPEEVVQGLHDAIRYTVRLSRENYTAGYQDVKQRLESEGHKMYYEKNQWDDAEYKGLNTRWITSEGQRFEIQFHTPESYHAKQEITHPAYERIRNRMTSDDERAALEAFQAEVSAWIPIPRGATDIVNHRKDIL